MRVEVTKKITFFTPTMKRTGSEIVLFNLVNSLSSEFSAKLISKYKGELLNKITSSVKPVFLYKQIPSNLSQRILNKLKKEIITPFTLLKCKESVWYINTIILSEFLEHAQKNNIKTILHVHELEQIFKDLPVKQIETLINYPELIIANSKATEQVLNKHGRTKPIKICYPAIDTGNIVNDKEIYSEFRKKLNISESSFVWLMSGTLDENKNPILFTEIAKEIITTHPNSIFIWIGGANINAFEILCKQTAVSLNLSDKIIWITNPGSDYLNYFNCANGFVLTSKKESFSLATLEAILLGLPVVAQDCDGVREILQNDIGKIVEERENPKRMADEMRKYMDGTYKTDIEKGRERAKEFDISIWSKKWSEILNDYFKNSI